MFIAELVNDCDIRLKGFALFADWRLNKKIETKITHGTLRDDVF